MLCFAAAVKKLKAYVRVDDVDLEYLLDTSSLKKIRETGLHDHFNYAIFIRV